MGTEQKIQPQRETGQTKVVFKGSGGKLYLFLDSACDMSELAQRVGERLAESPGFYQDAHLWVDWGDREPNSAEWSLLQQTVAAFGVALHRAQPQQVSRLGLKGRVTRMQWADSHDPAENGQGQPGLAGEQREPQVDAAVPAPGSWRLRPDAPRADHTLYVRRTLRSGQKVSYDGHVVILGNVHAGAEVVAGGDIIVFGKLAGVAHAGYPNDRQAVVVAWHLEPMQLRIATLISRAPDESAHPDTPELAEIRGDQIIVRRWDE